VFDLDGRVALVTGAGRSVGEGIAHALASRGAAVLVNDLDPARAASVVGQLRSRGATAEPAVFDVTDPDAVRDTLAEVTRVTGAVDICVNNAGNAGAADFPLERFVDLDPSVYERFVAVNLYGVLHCTRAVLPSMVERRWGRVITISSGAALQGTRLGVSVYGASKGAAVAFMRHLALEHARDGITANTLALGLMENADVPETEMMARTIPVGRLGTAADVGAACVWMASDDAAWLTGTTIPLDGGSSAG
jgi:NAD(P)-dependent dehydrogenase (short-subunit alcohol dehydrogenase family)